LLTDPDKQYAIIAGSGFASFGTDAEGRMLDTAFGTPSAPVRALDYGDHTVFFLARHGDALDIPPHAINYRANMKALRDSGVHTVIALNTVGVINPHIHPGQVAVPSQLIDYTSGRDHSIYEGGGELDHIDFTLPFTESVRQSLLQAGRRADVAVHDGGVYGVTQGPRLETAAEVDRFERDGVDLLGMTVLPEASLARELGMEYACLSLVVNHAAGRGERSIHEDLEASTMTAKMQAMKVLRVFFGETE
jgi:purine nucleoside phosphorylase